MPSRMIASRQMQASSQDIELAEVGTDSTWQLIPLSGSVSTVINASPEGVIIGADGQETGQSKEGVCQSTNINCK